MFLMWAGLKLVLTLADVTMATRHLTDNCCLLQRVDAPSLLRLLLNFDHLEAAAELVLEYVDAVLGRGHQYFGIEVQIHTEYCSSTA